MRHSHAGCLFKKKPYLHSKKILFDHEFIKSLPYCNCFAFAYLHKSPIYENYFLPEEEFIELMDHSDAWLKYKDEPQYSYQLRQGNPKEIYRDTYHKEAIKEWDAPFYYLLCDKNKTPQPGRMFFALLQYLYPVAKKPQARENYFWECYNRAKRTVMNQIPAYRPISASLAFEKMPKNTSAGFVSLKYHNERRKKGDCMDAIWKQYIENNLKLRKYQQPEDYCMFAMRGHLSDRLKIKTRPVWLVSASTIVSELRFYQPLYDLLETSSFFKNIWITGKQSIPRLNRYMRRHSDKYFYNTDISGWDSFRAAWFHRDIMRSVGDKIIMSHNDKLEFRYCIESAIKTLVLFPCGKIYQKLAGIISGTAGTLFFNSILNTIATLTILDMMNLFSYELFFTNVIEDPNWLGDDFAFFSFIEIDLEKFSNMMFKYFNVSTNVEKTIVVEPNNLDDRKYLGYQLKDGLLWRDEKELFYAVLYTERIFPKDETAFSVSFSRIFSYLLLGGVNNQKFMNYFYFFMGKFKHLAEKADSLFFFGRENIFKLLKDVWNFNIPNFKLDTLRKVSFECMKYCLLYGHDFRFSDITF